MRRWFGFFILMMGMQLAGPVWAATYEIDPDHSSVEFKIRHLFSYVRGSFDQFEGTIEYEPGNPAVWKASAVIQAASINTKVEKRDQHLRSKDFFEADIHPTVSFTSTEVTDATPESASIHGLLTLHGVQKPAVLDVMLHGVGKDPWGKTRSGFTATTKIDRKDFGLTWNKAVEAGQLLVGDEVDITIEVEAVLVQ